MARHFHDPQHQPGWDGMSDSLPSNGELTGNFDDLWNIQNTTNSQGQQVPESTGASNFFHTPPPQYDYQFDSSYNTSYPTLSYSESLTDPQTEQSRLDSIGRPQNHNERRISSTNDFVPGSLRNGLGGLRGLSQVGGQFPEDPLTQPGQSLANFPLDLSEQERGPDPTASIRHNSVQDDPPVSDPIDVLTALNMASHESKIKCPMGACGKAFFCIQDLSKHFKPHMSGRRFKLSKFAPELRPWILSLKENCGGDEGMFPCVHPGCDNVGVKAKHCQKDLENHVRKHGQASYDERHWCPLPECGLHFRPQGQRKSDLKDHIKSQHKQAWYSDDRTEEENNERIKQLLDSARVAQVGL